MDYLNNIQKFVTKKVNNLKNQFEKPQTSNDYVTQGMQMDMMGTQKPTSGSTKSNSLSAFLMAGNSQQAQQGQKVQQPKQVEDFAVNPLQEPPKKEGKPSNEFIQDFKLLRGEEPVDWEKCEIKIDQQDFPCKALITEYRIYLIPSFVNSNMLSNFQDSKRYEYVFPQLYFSLPIHLISSCEKTPEKVGTFKYSIIITARDGRVFELIFRVGQSNSFFPCLARLLSTKTTPNYFSFALKFSEKSPEVVAEYDGWKLYSPEAEYARQGLSKLGVSVNSEKDFRRTMANEEFSLCPTYPKFLVTTANISDSELSLAGKFRTKNRIPALSYFYYKTKGCIWRSSQVKVGITGNRNEFDEKYLESIAEVSSKKNLIVFDARPYMSAMANKLKGAGFEIKENYKNVDVVFCEMDNIHAARSALAKVFAMVSNENFSTSKKFHEHFDGTRWPEFIFLLIKSSINIATAISQGYSALIHCSDGWDRASQLTAFSQIFIDPFFRTIKGYMTLVEKDFLSFGHQFRFRNGYFSSKEASEDQNSPIFLQYLDATHQLLVQYPMYFEFNMEFLVFIANNINAGKYGTFLFNNEKERETQKAKEKTRSIWTDILRNIERFKNPFYDNRTMEEYCFLPNFSCSKLRLWEEYFMQYAQPSETLNYEYTITKREGNYLTRQKEVETECDNVFNNRMVSNILFIEKEKEKWNKCEKADGHTPDDLKKCLKELISQIDSSKLQSLSEETQKIIIDIKNEEGNKKESTAEDVAQDTPKKEEEPKKETKIEIPDNIDVNELLKDIPLDDKGEEKLD